MMIGWNRFNIYLLAATAVAVFSGCQSPERKRKRQLTRFELHLESRRDRTERNELIHVLRDHPIPLTVETEPFLTQGNIKAAKVVDSTGGFALSIQFDQKGAWLLEQYSSSNPGKRIAIFTQFGEKLKESRWLAAPKTSHRIADGVFIFTPDASREEAEEIALGLNNVAKKLKIE
jgi:preprotein translocase subunit SecD